MPQVAVIGWSKLRGLVVLNPFLSGKQMEGLDRACACWEVEKSRVEEQLWREEAASTSFHLASF